MMKLLKEITSQKVDLKNSDGSDAGKNDISNKAKANDIGFSSMRNTINSDGEVTGSDVANYLERAADINDEVDTVPFGLETDDGDIVKVYVNAEQADAFEEEMKKLLGVEDDIEEAINKLAQDFDIIDVVWPKDKTEDAEKSDELELGADDDFDALSDDEEEEPMDVVGEYDPLEEGQGQAIVDDKAKWKVFYDIYGSNREKPLYSTSVTFRDIGTEEEVRKNHQKLFGGRITKIEKIVKEGLFDVFKKKPEPVKPKRENITDEQREMIRKNFSDHNTDVKWSKEQYGSIYVLPKNITANAGIGRFAFTNEDGKLMVSVGWHRSKEDRMNPRVSPMISTDHEIKSEQDLKDLIKQAE